MKICLMLVFSLAIFGAGCSATSRASNSNTEVEQTPAMGSASEELDLRGRGLAVIPMDVFSRTNLVKLDLSNNRLTNAPQSQIGQLKNLVSLNLSHNSLTGLPAELGQLSKLEVLIVSNNTLTGLPMELGNLTQLRILDVSGNPYSVKDLNDIASRLPNTEIRR